MENAFTQWSAGALGQSLFAMEAGVLGEWLAGIFGYRLVQAGEVNWPGEDPLVQSAIRHKIVLKYSRASVWSPVVGEAARLPFASESIDLMLLPHTLDVCPDPQAVLREAERVLIPDGRLITVHFNPWSLWGGRRALASLTGKKLFPWNANFIGYVRVSDWLDLLGLEIEKTEALMFRPPFATEPMLARSAFVDRPGRRFWPMLAGAYMIQAVKRVPPLTPLRVPWRRHRRLGGMLEPSTRGMPHARSRNLH